MSSRHKYEHRHLSLDFRLLPVDGSSNEATALFTLDAAAQADIVIPNEAPDGEDPALVTGKLVVKLGGNALDFGETGPGNGGEVVMLVV